MTRHISLSISALALSAALWPTAGLAQYAAQPFFDDTVALSQAYGLESIGLRLDLATTFEAPYDEELVETIEGVTGAPLERFEATLTAADAELARDLREALQEVVEAAEEGEDTSAAVAQARELLAQAYEVVIPADLRETPAFTGGILIQLLLAEEGVAEGYEEAVEDNEPWEYPNGWVALQRVKALWAEIEGLASDELAEDGVEMIAALDELYPDAQPPESVAGWNPEEAEAPAQRFGGIIEAVVDADLYPGRDMGRLATHLTTLAGEACAAYEDDEALGRETIYAIYDLYDGELSGVASLFVPEEDEMALEMLEVLIGGDDDSGDACAQLESALTDIQGAFAG